jgi:hypothetical protein
MYVHLPDPLPFNSYPISHQTSILFFSLLYLSREYYPTLPYLTLPSISSHTIGVLGRSLLVLRPTAIKNALLALQPDPSPNYSTVLYRAVLRIYVLLGLACPGLCFLLAPRPVRALTPNVPCCSPIQRFSYQKVRSKKIRGPESR